MHPKKVSNLAIYRKERAANSSKCSNRPLYLLVETTSKCNLSCRMCNVHHNDRSGVSMDDAILGKTYYLAKKALSVAPYGLGEPLLRPDITTIIRRYKKEGCSVSLTTNGMLMTKKVSSGLIASGLDHLAISFDASDPSLFSEIRRGADLKTIGHHVMMMNLLKKKRRSETPALSLSVVVQASNFQQLPEIIQLAGQWGVPFVTLSPITVHKHIAEIQGEVIGPEFPGGKEIVERCYSEAAAIGVGIDTQRLDYVLNGSSWEELYRGTIPCPEPFRFMVIRANRDIFPCCNWDVNKPIARISVEQEDSVHLSVRHFEKAWQAPEWDILRKRIVSNDYPVECKACMANFTRPFSDQNLKDD